MTTMVLVRHSTRRLLMEEQAPSSSSQTKLYEDLSVTEDKDEEDPDKCFVSVSVTPFFVSVRSRV